MALSDSQLRGLKATDKRQVKSCGDSLYIVVESLAKGGGKSFMGVMRFPPRSPKNGGKRCEVRIGPYGKGVGKWSLKAARDEWERIRTWSREHKRDPRELKKEEREGPIHPLVQRLQGLRLLLQEVRTRPSRSMASCSAMPYRSSTVIFLSTSLGTTRKGWARRVVNSSWTTTRRRQSGTCPEQGTMVLGNVFTQSQGGGWAEPNQH